MDKSSFIILCMTVIIALIAFLVIKIFLMNRKKRNSKKGDMHVTEKKLLSLYKNLEDMIENVEIYIEHSSKKIKDERYESEKILAKMEETYAKIKNQSNKDDSKPEQKEPVKSLEKIDLESKTKQDREEVKTDIKYAKVNIEEQKNIEQLVQKNNGSKVSLVKELHSQGMNSEQISKKMSISQGEVNLIMGIRK